MKYYIFCLLSFISFSQESNYSDLSRFTIGFHTTEFDKGTNVADNPNYKGEIISFRTNSVFVDYRFLQFGNNSFKTGLFLNNYKKVLKSQGEIYNTFEGEYQTTFTYDGSSIAFIEKNPKLEINLDYNYLLKLKNNFYLQFGTGFSYELSHPSDYVEYTGFFVGDINDTANAQQTFYGIYVEEKTKWRFHISPSIGYKTYYGMFNVGVKYSIALKKQDPLFGNYTYLDPGPNGENKEYSGVFAQSGNYLSFTLSFTPSKSIFKKKK